MNALKPIKGVDVAGLSTLNPTETAFAQIRDFIENFMPIKSVVHYSSVMAPFIHLVAAFYLLHFFANTCQTLSHLL